VVPEKKLSRVRLREMDGNGGPDGRRQFQKKVTQKKDIAQKSKGTKHRVGKESGS